MQNNDPDTVKQFSGEEEEIKCCVGGLVELDRRSLPSYKVVINES